MAKKQKQQTKTCSDCIHENACRIWTDGRFISDASASVCPNHETVKESSAYLCGVWDERKRRQTNAQKIRAMSDEELAKHLTDIGWDCHFCVEHLRLDNEPLLRGEKCDEKCAEHCFEWLKQPVKEEQ